MRVLLQLAAGSDGDARDTRYVEPTKKETPVTQTTFECPQGYQLRYFNMDFGTNVYFVPATGSNLSSSSAVCVSDTEKPSGSDERGSVTPIAESREVSALITVEGTRRYIQ